MRRDQKGYPKRRDNQYRHDRFQMKLIHRGAALV
jgi:hypothetical protein